MNSVNRIVFFLIALVAPASPICPYDLYKARENWKYSMSYDPKNPPRTCPGWEIQNQNEDNVNYSLKFDGSKDGTPTLTSLSASGFNMPTIREISISNTSIVSLPSNLLQNIPSLETLTLSSNKINEIPQGFLNGLTSLRDFDMGFNKINAIPHGLFNFTTNLETLILSGNLIRRIDSSNFKNIKKITTLYLSENKLTSFPSSYLNYIRDKLAVLDLANNSISKLDTNFLKNMPKLQVFWVANNPLTSFAFLSAITTQDVPSLSRLSISTDYLPQSELNNNLFAVVQNTSINHLELSFNQINSLNLKPSFLKPLNLIQTLALKVTGFYNSEIFNELNYLKNLSLKSSNLTTLPKGLFKSMTNLVSLDLSNNFLQNLTKEHFTGLQNLKKLDLSYNRMTWVNDGLFDVFKNKIDHLAIQNNFFNQVQKNVYIQSFENRIDETQGAALHPLKSFFISPGYFVCYPREFDAKLISNATETNLQWLKKVPNKSLPYKQAQVGLKAEGSQQSTGICTICAMGESAENFENVGNDCKPCKEGTYCPEKGMFAWNIKYCAEGKWSTLGSKSESACYPCPEGNYCPGRAQLKLCPVGFFSKAGQTKCSKCPIGTMTNLKRNECVKCPIGTYSDDGNTCKKCAAGRYGDTTGLTDSSCSGPCAEGSYCPDGSYKADMKPCPAGTYSDKPGQKTEKCAGLCEKGYYCPEGSKTATPFKCKKGYYGALYGAKTEKCDGSCAPNHICDEGSTDFFQTDCKDGKQSKLSGDKCIICDEKKYSLTDNECVECGGTKYLYPFYSSKQGADMLKTLMCPGCSPGLWNYYFFKQPSGNISTECMKCGPGTYNPQTGSYSQSDCKKCPFNTYSSKTGLTSEQQCTPCPNNTWSSTEGATSDDFCLRCPAGQEFEKDKVKFGAVLEEVCVDCRKGKYSNVKTNGCKDCHFGLYSDRTQRKIKCEDTCEKYYFCPEGSYEKMQVRFPQRNRYYTLAWGYGVGVILLLNSLLVHSVYKYLL
eukprot:GAHX01001012.1.p1 GENE.GAHX01001012.1~~GAHX01001012.1.p1  ORF type:complete len:1000 (-),score=168.16 GAHX01001012.1:19-3018(-)